MNAIYCAFPAARRADGHGVVSPFRCNSLAFKWVVLEVVGVGGPFAPTPFPVSWAPPCSSTKGLGDLGGGSLAHLLLMSLNVAKCYLRQG